MPHRSYLIAGLLLVAGCSGGLYEFPTEPGTAEPCAALIEAAPDEVGGQAQTPTDSDRVAAWGDPRILLRCGVEQPKALEPTSRCDDVDGVGWFAEEADGKQVFTTVGRDPDVSVEVPDSVEPAASALIDLADLVKTQTTETDPCI